MCWFSVYVLSSGFVVGKAVWCSSRPDHLQMKRGQRAVNDSITVFGLALLRCANLTMSAVCSTHTLNFNDCGVVIVTIPIATMKGQHLHDTQRTYRSCEKHQTMQCTNGPLHYTTHVHVATPCPRSKLQPRRPRPPECTLATASSASCCQGCRCRSPCCHLPRCCPVSSESGPG